MENFNLPAYLGPVYLADTIKNGLGIFAARDFAAGELLFRASGALHQEPYEPGRYMVGEHWLGIGRQTWLVPPESDPLYFLNHSCRPNASIARMIEIFAVRPIPKDQEVTIDYSLTEEDPYWKMECRCGKENCCRVIRGTAVF